MFYFLHVLVLTCFSSYMFQFLHVSVLTCFSSYLFYFLHDSFFQWFISFMIHFLQVLFLTGFISYMFHFFNVSILTCFINLCFLFHKCFIRNKGFEANHSGNFLVACTRLSPSVGLSLNARSTRLMAIGLVSFRSYTFLIILTISHWQ